MKGTKGTQHCGLCGSEGHNRRTCARASEAALPLPPTVASPLALAVPKCRCRGPPEVSVMRETKKEGPNFGRRFFTCGKWPADSKCNFFEWKDELAALDAPGEAVAFAPPQEVVEEEGLCRELARVFVEGEGNDESESNGDEEIDLLGASVAIESPQRCGCKGSCDSKRCACAKGGRHCNPELCSCCTLRTMPFCSNVDTDAAYYYAEHPSLPDVRTCLAVGEGKNSLVVASWNIQSFGFNMFYVGGGTKRLSRPFLAAIDKVASFVLHHNVDMLFIQETMESAALDYLVTHLNSTDNTMTYRVDWVPRWVAVGQGFNIGDAKAENRPDELAAVIHKDFRSHSLHWQVVNPLQMIEFLVEGLHSSFTELRDRFKRHPAYMTVRVGTELTCFAVLHLASDGGKQTLRLNKEIEALPGLAARLKEMTGADNVVLLGDFNRDPNTVAFSGLTRSGHFPALKEGRTNHPMRSNRQTKPHLYDNFWLPGALLTRAAVAIGEERWMKLEHRGVPLERPISDHRPVILELNHSPA